MNKKFSLVSLKKPQRIFDFKRSQGCVTQYMRTHIPLSVQFIFRLNETCFFIFLPQIADI